MPGVFLDALKFRVLTLFSAAIILLFMAFLATAARPAPDGATPFQAKDLFPGVEGEIEFKPLDKLPTLTEARLRGAVIGYVFSTQGITNSVGYSGKSLDIEVGLFRDGRIAGARLAHHEEPILLIGVSNGDLDRLVKGLIGMDIRQSASLRKAGPGGIDHIAGATISSTVIRDTVFRASRRVASVMGITGGGAARQHLDLDFFEPKSWDALLAANAIARLTVSRGEAAAPFKRAEAEPDAVFVDLYTALITPALTGQNLLGRQEYENISAENAAGGNAILVAANGLYSFKGTAYRRTGHFERLQIVQGAATIQLTSEGYRNVSQLAAANAPEFREIGVFRIPENAGFDAAKPWRLELLVQDGAGGGDAQPAVFSVSYRAPDSLISSSAAAPALDERPIWKEIWEQRRPEIVIAVALIVVLAGILLFQDALTRRARLFRATRLSFLTVTVVFLGFYAGAQLSVLNIVAFAQGLLQGFRWENYLIDPLIFILWSFVALALLFWGRGVFCGWLCPFGALQELLSEAARRLGVKQIQMPWPLHERLWPIKYIAFLVIFGLSLNSAADAAGVAEIEPFKTVFVLKFNRELIFVIYAVSLLVMGLFIERFYCRYLCPLGAGLAIPAKLRLFEWLKRRPQCGSECHICEIRCTVQAIDPIGQINPNECIYCLNCQVNYHDSKTCMVLIRREARRQGQGSATPPPPPGTPPRGAK